MSKNWLLKNMLKIAKFEICHTNNILPYTSKNAEFQKFGIKSRQLSNAAQLLKTEDSCINNL